MILICLDEFKLHSFVANNFKPNVMRYAPLISRPGRSQGLLYLHLRN